MSLTIWKYEWPLPHDDLATFHMPLGASVLSVQNQGGMICLWALVDGAEEAQVARRFQLFPTGGSAPHPLHSQFIGTVQLHYGHFIGHIFEILMGSTNEVR